MIKYLFPLCLVALPFSGWANSLDSALLACKKVVNATERLACFDQIQLPDTTTASAITNQSTLPVMESQTIAVAESKAIPVENSFGLEHKTSVKDQLPSSVEMVLKHISKTPFGVQIFSFENGQIWRQATKETFIARIGKTYILERAAFNSFLLGEAGSGRKTRVRRDK